MFFGFKKKNNSSSSTSNSTPVKTETTTSTNSSAKVVLSKAEDGLERHIVRLKKEKNIDLSSHRARVFVVMDRSGSMTSLYQSGEIQNVLTRLLPLALKFDDNGELEVYVFNTSCIQMPSMNLSNYESYVKREIMNKGYGPSGGTSYSPVIEKTMSIYDDGSSYPAFDLLESVLKISGTFRNLMIWMAVMLTTLLFSRCLTLHVLMMNSCMQNCWNSILSG